jgi:L-lactate dehydrogenase (cytochrome)
VLPAMRAAIGELPLMVDSGFRRGSDVLKALALGADFVFIGRPFNYAAAIAGAAGVAHAAALLASEIDACMGLLGINRLDELGPVQLMPRAAGFPALADWPLAA